jgi:CheY-like chemotaxis protein/glycine cleavage system H lipoate-binding protein
MMRKRILVVDDEEIVLGAVRKALRKTDLHLDTAQSAEEALNLLADKAFDVVITDMMMPGMDGLELMRRMRNRGNEALTIMLTGYPSVQTALKAKKLGAFDYVTKPFARQELLSVVVRALRLIAVDHSSSNAPASIEHPESAYFIPEHSWARLEPDKTVRIGMARAFAASVGEVIDLEFPAIGDCLEQGRMCLAIRAEEGVVHHLHSPLSGQVLEVNEAVIQNTDLALMDPEGRGWLLRLAPQNPDSEIENLMPAGSTHPTQPKE